MRKSGRVFCQPSTRFDATENSFLLSFCGRLPRSRHELKNICSKGADLFQLARVTEKAAMTEMLNDADTAVAIRSYCHPRQSAAVASRRAGARSSALRQASGMNSGARDVMKRKGYHFETDVQKILRCPPEGTGNFAGVNVERLKNIQSYAERRSKNAAQAGCALTKINCEGFPFLLYYPNRREWPQNKKKHRCQMDTEDRKTEQRVDEDAKKVLAAFLPLARGCLPAAISFPDKNIFHCSFTIPFGEWKTYVCP